jgi:hypothetical protein
MPTTVDAPREPIIEAAVDWLGDGGYSLDESDTTSRLVPDSLQVQRGRDAARPLGQPMVPGFSWKVNNYDRLYSPEYALSNLFHLILPGKGMRIRMTVGSDQVDYNAAISYNATVFYNGRETIPVITGVLDEPEHQTALGQMISTLPGLGVLSRLRGTRISTPLYATIRTDQAIGHILDAVNWPSNARVIATGDTTLDWWWCDDQDAFEAIVQLLATEGPPSYFGEDTQGRAVFENRNYRTSAARSMSSRAVFYDRVFSAVGYNDPIDYNAAIPYNGSSQLYHQGVQPYSAGFKDIYNQVTCAVTRRATQTLQKVWEYGQAVTLGPAESRLVEVRLSDPCSGALAPVNGTDYTVAAGALSTAPTLENVNAKRLGIRFVATGAGAVINGVTSNGPQLRAQPTTVISQGTERQSIDSSASIAKYGGVNAIPRPLQVGALPEINSNTAIALCDAVAAFYQDPRATISVKVTNIDALHLTYQLTLDVSDRISVVSEPLGLYGDFWIEQVQQQREGMKLVTTYVCERVLNVIAGGLWGAFDGDPTAGRWDVDSFGR